MPHACFHQRVIGSVSATRDRLRSGSGKTIEVGSRTRVACQQAVGRFRNASRSNHGLHDRGSVICRYCKGEQYCWSVWIFERHERLFTIAVRLQPLGRKLVGRQQRRQISPFRHRYVSQRDASNFKNRNFTANLTSKCLQAQADCKLNLQLKQLRQILSTFALVSPGLQLASR